MSDQRLARITFVLVEAVLILAIPILAVRGFQAVLDTTDGRTVDASLAADDPGFEAFVEPTPVLLVVGVDDEQALSWAALLVLSGSGERGGAIVLLPPTTQVPNDALFGFPAETLRARWASHGPDAARQGLAQALGVGIEEHVVVDPGRLVELVSPVLPLTLDLADPVDDLGPGEVQVDAAALATIVVAEPEGENQLNRLVRLEAFWSAWLGAVAASTDPDVVAGEVTTGIGRFVRGIAAGVVVLDVPPLVEILDAVEPSGLVYATDPGVTDDLEERIPFPVSAFPGARLRVRVLDGVGVDGLTLAMARDVVRSGGQVVVAGNSDRFDAAESRIVYFDGALTEQVEAMAAELGIGVEQLEGLNPDDGVDATVVAGADVLATYGLAPPPTTNGKILADLDLDEATRWAVEAARAADDKKGLDVLVLAVGEVLAITEHFVIADGTNPWQVKTIADAVEERLTRLDGPKPRRVEGLDDLTWVLMDYGDFVVHVFNEESRRYYELERLWADVPKVDWAE